MSTDDSDFKEYRAELNDDIDDGGGCCEAWETMASRRNRDEPETSRRGFLKTAASALGVSVAGLASLTREVKAAADEHDVEQLKGRDRRTALADALSDSRTKDLRSELLNRGYRPAVNDAYTVRSEGNGEAWRTVVIPFRDGDPSQQTQTYIAWSDNTDYEQQVSAHHVERYVPEDNEPYWVATSLYFEGGNIVEAQTEIPNFLGCNNVSWGCVLTLAGAYTGTIAACGSCAASGGWLVWACAACISAILSSGGATLLCDWCND